MKASRKKYKEKAKIKDDADFYVVVVFSTGQELDKFLSANKLPLDERFIDGKKLATLMGVNLD